LDSGSSSSSLSEASALAPDQDLPSAGFEFGRGRGRGNVHLPRELLKDEPQTALAAPLREREDPGDPEDSDDSSDFISAYKKWQPNKTRGTQSEERVAGRGRGRGVVLKNRKHLQFILCVLIF